MCLIGFVFVLMTLKKGDVGFILKLFSLESIFQIIIKK